MTRVRLAMFRRNQVNFSDHKIRGMAIPDPKMGIKLLKFIEIEKQSWRSQILPRAPAWLSGWSDAGAESADSIPVDDTCV